MTILHKSFDLNGDTIVEVLVVLAILGFAIAISYATADRSLLNVRQAQESSTATEIGKSQIEQLRQLASLDSTDPNYIFNPNYESSPFCINANGSGDVAIPVSGTSSPCFVNPQYEVAITYAPAVLSDPAGGGTFKILITWPDVEGQGNDTNTFVYQLFNSNQPIVGQQVVQAPSNVSWFNFGYESVPTGGCSNPSQCTEGPNSILVFPSVQLQGNASVTYDYTVQQPTQQSGEATPGPGETGLTLKLCYEPTPGVNYQVAISIGGASPYLVTLPPNGPSDDLCESNSSVDEAFELINVSTPPGSNHSVVVSTVNNTGNVLRIYDITIYSTSQ